MTYEFAALLFILSALLAAISQTMLKKSALKQYIHRYQEYANPLVVSSYAILFSTTLINMQAYTVLPYKYGNILTSSSYIFVLVISRFLFGEKITLKKVAGMGLIILGICVFVL